MRPALAALIVLLCIVSAGGAPRHAGATATSAMPHSQLVDEVMTFLVSDVGVNGISTMDGDPLGEPVPPYFYHFAIQPNNNLRSNTSGYPGYASISYPGYTMAIAIDAFLAWWAHTGDPQFFQRALDCADWLIPRRTPAADLYGNWVYSTQTDGVMGGGYDGEGIMSDKSAMFGRRLLRLFDATGDSLYWNVAIEIADTYVATQQTGGPENAGRWPYRVRPSDGLVVQDYTSHLVPAIELLGELESRRPGHGYGIAADAAWDWLFSNPMNPVSPEYMRWEGFYEDIGPESAGLRDHYSAENTIASLVLRNAPGDIAKAIEILNWSTDRYLAPDGVHNGSGIHAPALLEWDAWPNSTFAANGQWAYVNLLLDEATSGSGLHDSAWRPRAIEALHTLTWGQDTRNTDGRMFTSIRQITEPDFTPNDWYEQSFNTVIYTLLGMGFAPELAPDGENHLLRFDGGELQSIQYAQDRTTMEWSGQGRALLKLATQPYSVKIDGQWLPGPQSLDWESSSSITGWSWDPARNVCILGHPGGRVEIVHGGETAALPPLTQAAAQLLPPTPNPFNPSVVVAFTLERPAVAELRVVDVRGRHVTSLLHEERAAGNHQVRWDGRDSAGQEVASGVYRVILVVEGEHSSRPMTLVR